MSTPRKDARITLRVPSDLKQQIADLMAGLRADGHVVNEADVVHMFIREGLSKPQIVERLQEHRRDLHHNR